jgi:hypothetical protein
VEVSCGSSRPLGHEVSLPSARAYARTSLRDLGKLDVGRTDEGRTHDRTKSTPSQDIAKYLPATATATATATTTHTIDHIADLDGNVTAWSIIWDTD